MTEEKITLELSHSEYQEIMNRRAMEAHKKATRDFQLRAIKVASDYIEWSSENGFILPDSGTFVNQFGYEEDDHSIMRNAVQEIWKLVFSFHIPLEKAHD